MRRWIPVVVALTAIAAHADPLVLCDNGASNYEIVVLPEAGKVAQFAATELQKFVAQSTGVKLPIVTVVSPDRDHLFLGANGVSATCGVKADELQPEGFHLRTVGRDIHLVGKDTAGDPTRVLTNYPCQTGTLTAVYEFLERFVGVTFCWHDDLGTIVPPHQRVVIPDTDLTQAPAYEYRMLGYGPEGQETFLFGRRLRLGHPISVQHWHNWANILPAEKYGQEHPEYFALVKGERQARYYLGHHGGQVCTSNPAVVDIFVRAALDFFKANPDRDMFSLSPNDGGGFCECDNCRALDAGQFLADPPGQPVLTDRMLHFYNQIAERVAAVYPNKLLGAYAYSTYQQPPVREQVHPNLYLLQATNSCCGQGVRWTEEHAGEKQWMALTKRFGKYDIPYLPEASLELIAPVTTHLIERVKDEEAIGFTAAYEYASQGYEQLGAGMYVLARTMWDKDADARALEQRYYAALYGPAAAEVKAYYDLLEGRLRKVYLQAIDVEEPVVKQLTPRPQDIYTPGHIIAAYWPILGQAEALMKQAEARPLDTLQRQRLARLRDYHELTVATVRGLVAAGRLEMQSKFNPDDVAMLKAAVDQREAVKARLAVYAPTVIAALKDLDQGVTARVSPQGAFYQITRGQKPLQLQAAKTAQPLQIDGLAKEAVWAQAPPSYLLLTKSAVAPQLGARAKLAWDDETLYVFIEGREQDAGKLIKEALPHDSDRLFDSDNVELFVQPPGTKAYYHLALNAAGSTYDAAHPGGDALQADVKWESQAQTAVAMGDGGWSAEVAIPFAAFGAKPDQPGWHINLCRTRRGNVEPDEYTAVNPTFGGFHEPAHFPEAVFSATPEAIGFPDGTMDDVPAADDLKRLRVQTQGNATAELVSDRAYCGSQALHLAVKDGLAALTLQTKVKPEIGYRVVVAHVNSGVTINPEVRPQAPITRAIFYDQDWKATTETTGYAWSGVPALENPDQWRQSAQTFTTPPNTVFISYTLFFHHPGEYWVDEVRLEELQ